MLQKSWDLSEENQTGSFQRNQIWLPKHWGLPRNGGNIGQIWPAPSQDIVVNMHTHGNNSI